MKKENTLIVSALLVIVLGLAWYLWFGGKDVVNADKVSAVDQAATDRITVESVNLKEPGYVAIYADSGGMPGEMLGNGELLVGRHKDVVVFLKREAKQGETLYVILHRDDGDGGFEFPGQDAPVTDETSRIILDSFVVLES
ncbi:MAG: hypothetical protein HYS89_00520 [Candidatus Colwellbacteria bacterium]|nr:hypothetical protein [Candidatus Colwellbacteria bacterium]